MLDKKHVYDPVANQYKRKEKRVKKPVKKPRKSMCPECGELFETRVRVVRNGFTVSKGPRINTHVNPWVDRKQPCPGSGEPPFELMKGSDSKEEASRKASALAKLCGEGFASWRWFIPGQGWAHKAVTVDGRVQVHDNPRARKQDRYQVFLCEDGPKHGAGWCVGEGASPKEAMETTLRYARATLSKMVLGVESLHQVVTGGAKR